MHTGAVANRWISDRTVHLRRDVISRSFNISKRLQYRGNTEDRVLQSSLGFVDSMSIEVVL
jgi:hypothetical protein